MNLQKEACFIEALNKGGNIQPFQFWVSFEGSMV